MLFKKNKRGEGYFGKIIGIFVLVLVLSALLGMTFLFTSGMKDTISDTADEGENSTAWQAVNDTEKAGADVVGYLPLLFLALIFSAVLVVILKIIIPVLNSGQLTGSGF